MPKVSKMDTRDTIRAKLLKKAKDQINQKMAGREIHIIKAVNLLSDLDSITNLLGENASEWKMRQPTADALKAFNELEKNTEHMTAEKKTLSEFIEKEMSAEFPNFSVLATPILGAKLLASAGSKKRLMLMPASTIQVLGAEKALFAHMRKNAKSPKHGHLFNHPLMQKLPRFKRGKVARIIAGKLAIALKQDYFEGENTSKEVLKALHDTVAKIAQEPITAKQEARERELIALHDGSIPKDFEAPENFSKPRVESKTWTPEERRAFFAKQNEEKGIENPTTETKEGESPAQKTTDDYPRERRSFSDRPRERSSSGFRERRSYAPRREGSSYGERRSFAPRRDSGSSFGERRSFGTEGSYPRRSSFGDRPRERSSSGFRERRSFAPRREGSFSDRPRREGSFGSRSSFGDRPRRESSFGGERRSYAPRKEGSFSENPEGGYPARRERPFKPRTENFGEDRGGAFGAASNFSGRRRFSTRKKFVKKSRE